MKAVIGLDMNGERAGKASTVRLVGVTQPDKGVKGEGGIPDPRCSVIPVPAAADKLWEGECRTGNNSASRFVNEQLQSQSAPVNGFLPRSLVGGSANPVDPIMVCGLGEGLDGNDSAYVKLNSR
jgi:hypothetical protein